jgi:hypothetical protein
MKAVDTSSSNSASSRNASQGLAAVRMPIDEPVGDLDDAVRKLKQCSSTELRRARQHHRRALESLRQGGYSALSESTRDRLISRLRHNLKALNRALDVPASGSDASPQTDGASEDASFASRFRAFFQTLW